MRNILLTASLIAGVALKSVATLPVIDYTHIAQDAGNEVVNLAKWTASELHEAQTDLNTLNSYEETLLQVERMGDPKALVANIPGVQNIQLLGQMYAQGEKDVSDWASFANPQSWKMTAQGILNIYGEPGFNGFTSANGAHLGSPQSLVQFQVSNFNTYQSAQQTISTLTQQLKTETQELAQATSAMQSATTEAQVAKFSASINALHAAVNATNGALQQAKFSQQLQTLQNSTAQEISRETNIQQQASAAYQAIDDDMNQLPSGNFRQLTLWGQN